MQQQAFFALLDVIIAWLQEYINVGSKLEKQCVACNLILNIKIESMNEIINTDKKQKDPLLADFFNSKWLF